MSDVHAIPWLARLAPLVEYPARRESSRAHPAPVRDPVERRRSAPLGSDSDRAWAGGRALAVAHDVRRLANAVSGLRDREAVAARVRADVAGLAGGDGSGGVRADHAFGLDLRGGGRV